MAAIYFSSGEAELNELIRDLEHWENRDNVVDTFQRPLGVMGAALAARVRANVLSNSSKNQNARRGRRSLRKAIAAATEAERWERGDVGAVTVKVDAFDMAYGDRGLPKLYEGVSDWVHPVYGDAPYVSQSPDPYFSPAVRGVEKGLNAAGESSVDRIADHIESG